MIDQIGEMCKHHFENNDAIIAAANRKIEARNQHEIAIKNKFEKNCQRLFSMSWKWFEGLSQDEQISLQRTYNCYRDNENGEFVIFGQKPGEWQSI